MDTELIRGLNELIAGVVVWKLGVDEIVETELLASWVECSEFSVICWDVGSEIGGV